MTDEYLKARDKAADEELYSQTISDRINGFAARDFFKRGHDAGYTRGKEEASEEIARYRAALEKLSKVSPLDDWPQVVAQDALAATEGEGIDGKI
jgi:hypothetical protein